MLTQNDVRSGGKFDDIVAYGGWSMDDHRPAGLLYPGRMTELQQTLMDDDVWLPGFKRQASPLSLSANRDAVGQGVQFLCDGHDRPIGEQPHAWTGPVCTPSYLRVDSDCFNVSNTRTPTTATRMTNLLYAEPTTITRQRKAS